MTGTLDGGMRAIFGAAFASLYLDATLHRRTTSVASDGDVTASETDEDVKAHFDRITETMRRSEGYADGDVAILALQVNAAGDQVSPAPTTDDEITLGGQRWAIGSIEADPAATHWIIRGRAA